MLSKDWSLEPRGLIGVTMLLLTVVFNYYVLGLFGQFHTELLFVAKKADIALIIYNTLNIYRLYYQ